MKEKDGMSGILLKIERNGSIVGAMLLVGIMIIAPFASAAGGTISGTVYNSNSYTLGQAQVELYNYIKADTLSTIIPIQSDSLVETDRTWVTTTPIYTIPTGVTDPSPLFGDTTATNSKPNGLGISINYQYEDALGTNTPFTGTAASSPQINDSMPTNTQPAGSVSINPRRDNTTATNTAPLGSTPAITSQTSNTTSTNISPSGSTAAISIQSSNSSSTYLIPTGLTSPTGQTNDSLALYTAPLGGITITNNSEDATSTAVQPNGTLMSLSGTWYIGNFTLEANDDGNSIAEDVIYWVLTDNITSGYYDLMNLSYGNPLNFTNGSTQDQFVGPGDDEGISFNETVTLGTYRFLVNFTSNPSTDSPDAWFKSTQWFVGSFILDVNGDGTPGPGEAVNYSLSDSNSDGMYDTMELSSDDITLGEGAQNDNMTSFDNDERLGISGGNVTFDTYQFTVSFVENPNSTGSDATVISNEWYNGSLTIDADDDGVVDDTIFFALSDITSDGLYDTMDISFNTTYGEGSLGDANVTVSDDERISTTTDVRIGSFLFSADFSSSPANGSVDAGIMSMEWYEGTFSIDGDGDGIVESDNIYYVLSDTNSDGLYEAMDISCGDEVYGEGDIGNVTVDFSDTDNLDDERIITSSSIILGDYLQFSVDFDTSPNMDPYDAQINITEWYEGAFTIDADGDGLSDDDVYFILTDTDSDGLYEIMDISIGDEVYGEGDIGNLTVDFDATDNQDDERISVQSNVTLGNYHQFVVEFDAAPNADSDDAQITSNQWYEGSFTIDADDSGFADDNVYYVLSDSNSNGTYDAMEISIEDQVFGETASGTLSDDIVDYFDVGDNNNDELINQTTDITLGDSLSFTVSFDSTPTAGSDDSRILIYEWYNGTFLIDADDTDDDGIDDDNVNFVLTDTDSDGLFDTMDISINDIIFGEAGVGGLADGFVDVYNDSNNVDDERITSITNLTLGDSLLFTVEFDNNPNNTDLDDARILSNEWYEGTFALDVNGDGVVDVGGMNYTLIDFQSRGLYTYYMEITTDDGTYAENDLWDHKAQTDNDEIIIQNDFVFLGTYNYTIRIQDGVNDGLDVNDGVNYDANDVKLTISQWQTGSAQIEGNARNATMADIDSDGLFDELYIDINDDGDYDDVGIDVIALQTWDTFQGSLLELQYTIISLDPSGQYFEIQPTGASMGSTASWFFGEIEAPAASGDTFYVLLSDTDGDSNFDCVDFDSFLPQNGIVDVIGLTETSGTVDLNGTEYQVINIEDSGAYVRISSFLDAVLSSINDVSLSNTIHHGIISESILSLNLNQDGDITDVYHTIVVDDMTAGVYESVFLDCDNNFDLSDGSKLGVGSSFSILASLPMEDHTFEIDFINSTGDGYSFTQTNHPVDSEITSADGIYSLDASIDGYYWVKVSNSTGSWGYAIVADTNSNSGYNIIGGSGQHMDFILTQTGSFIFGHVNDSISDSPIVSVLVEVYDSLGGIVVSTLTKADGTYQMAVVQGGTYDMVYSSQGYYTDDGRATGTWQDILITTDTSSVDVLLVKDDIPPSITLDYPLEGQTVGGLIDVTAKALDDFLITEVAVSFDYGATYYTMTNAGGDNFTYSWHTSAHPEGTTRVYVRVTDDAGNTASDYNDVYVSNDATPPTISIVTPVDSQYVESFLTIQVLATDNHALQFVNITLNGSSHEMGYNPSSGYYEYITDTTLLHDGLHNLSAEAIDYAGNNASDSLLTGFYVDNTPPTLSIYSPLNLETVSDISVFIDVDSVDIGVYVPTVQYKIDSGPWMTLTGSEFAGWADSWDSTMVSNGIHTIHFRTYDDIGHTVTDSVTVTVDNDYPEVDIVTPFQDELVQGTYTFSVYAFDEVEITNVYITISGNDYVTGYNSASGLWEASMDTTNFNDGNYWISATAEDGVSWHQGTTTPIEFSVDNNAPALSINSPAEGETVYGSTVSIDADSIDIGPFVPTVQYRIDSGAWQDLSGTEVLGWTDTWNSTMVSNGIHIISFRSFDGIGHMVTDSVTVTVDNDNPLVYLVAPMGGEFIQGTYTFSVYASDEIGLTSVWITIDAFDYITGYSSASGLWKVTIDTTNFEDAPHDIYATAEDGIAVHTQVTIPIEFGIDNNAPSLDILSPLNGQIVYGSTVALGCNSTDPGPFIPSVEFKIDSWAWQDLSGSEGLGWTETWDSQIVSNGIHTLTFRAYDSIGHVTTDSVTITVDNDAPQVAINAPIGNEFISGTYIFKVYASDEIGVTSVYITISGNVYIASENSANGLWEVAIDTATLPDGTYSIFATVEDGIPGHTRTTSSFDFNIDNNAPSLSVISPASGETVYGSDIAIDVNSTDSGIFVPTVQYKIDGGAWNTLTGSEGLGWTDSWDSTTVSNGLHTISFRTYDNIPHVVTDSIIITVDNDNPTAAFVAPVSGEYIQGTYVFSVSASDDVGVTDLHININGDVYTTGYNSANGLWEVAIDSGTIPDGTYSISATVEDGIAGHTRTTTPYNFNIDNTVPTLYINSPVLGETVFGSIVAIDVNSTDSGVFVPNVQFRVDSGPWITLSGSENMGWTGSWDSSGVSNGLHTITFRTYDDIGHVVTESITITVDNDEPQATIVSPVMGEYLQGTYTFSISAKDDIAVTNLFITISSTDYIAGYNSANGYWEVTMDSKTLADGTYGITATAEDGILSHTITTTSFTFYIDNTEPELTINSPQNQEHVRGSVTLDIKGSDTFLDSVEYSVDGTGWILSSTPWQTTLLADGSHTLTFRVFDLAGHTILRSITVIVDNTDTDSDGIGDLEDPDIDGDGVSNNDDAYPYDPNESKDTDSDGIGDNTDLDDDGDSVVDTQDDFPDNPNEWQDTDSDGLGDNSDLDDDGDGVLDTDDDFPKDDSEYIDTDSDKIGDNADLDDDGDGVLDTDDDFPKNPEESSDFDSDGIGDNSDNDIDGDGVYNSNDIFPYDATESSDLDEDGIGDNTDFDIDGDGVYNINDAFDYLATESKDTDSDGIGDNNDEDDDGDQVPDTNDAFPKNATEWRDTDSDGIGDNRDSDIDGDGILNDDDEFLDNPNEWRDTDGDGIGDNADTDDDNDGIVDREDYYPLDNSQYLEPFWWWWILIAVLIVLLVMVTFITHRRPLTALGDEEEYGELSRGVFQRSKKRKYERLPDEKEETVSTSKETEEEEHEKEDETKAGSEEIECPACGESFSVDTSGKPSIIKCPHCGVSGTID